MTTHLALRHAEGCRELIVFTPGTTTHLSKQLQNSQATAGFTSQPRETNGIFRVYVTRNRGLFVHLLREIARAGKRIVSRDVVRVAELIE